MKHLLTTTAIILVTALPVLADSHGGADMDAAARVSVEDRDLGVAGLMRARVYLPERYTMDTDDITAVPHAWDAVGTVEQVLVADGGALAMLVVAPSEEAGAGADRIALDLADLDIMTVAGDENEIVAVYTGGMDGFTGAGAFDEAAARDMGLTPAGDGMGGAGGGLTDDIAATAEDIGDAAADAGAAIEGAADAVGEAAGDAAEATEQAAGDVAASTEEAARDLAQDLGIDPATLTAEDLDGATVHEPSGDPVGEISEIVLSDDGMIEKVVIDVGGFLGIGEKPVALPFDELDITKTNGLSGLRVEIGHSQEELEAMETWNG